MIKMTCRCGCKRTRMVREADIKRGWGKYYSKSCKAKHQEKRTHQFAQYREGQNQTTSEYMEENWGHPMASGYEGHGQN